MSNVDRGAAGPNNIAARCLRFCTSEPTDTVEAIPCEGISVRWPRDGLAAFSEEAYAWRTPEQEMKMDKEASPDRNAPDDPLALRIGAPELFQKIGRCLIRNLPGPSPGGGPPPEAMTRDPKNRLRSAFRRPE